MLNNLQAGYGQCIWTLHQLLKVKLTGPNMQRYKNFATMYNLFVKKILRQRCSINDADESNKMRNIA